MTNVFHRAGMKLQRKKINGVAPYKQSASRRKMKNGRKLTRIITNSVQMEVASVFNRWKVVFQRNALAISSAPGGPSQQVG